MLEIYSSYLPWDYVSWSTKVAILSELADRVECDVNDARALVDSPALDHITQMLGSPDIGARISSSRLLASLAKHKCTIPAILELKTCERLVSLLTDEDYGVIARALFALFQIARLLDGAEAIVNAKVLNEVPVLLESTSPEVRNRTFELVGMLAKHDSTGSDVFNLKPCMRLVACLGDENVGVVQSAMYALSEIAGWSDGVQAIVDAKAVDHVLALLESRRSGVREWTCELVGRLARDPSTATAVLKLKPYEPLVYLLGDEDWQISARAVFALSQIAHSLDGAQAVVDAKALDHVLKLLHSPRTKLRRWTCELVGRLASHFPTAETLLELKPCLQLVALLRHEKSLVDLRALFALCQIARWLDGAEAIVNAHALDHVLVFLESRSSKARGWTCKLVGRLASHASTVSAVLDLKLCGQLVSFLREPATRGDAMFALCAISEWPDGVAALANIDLPEEQLSRSLNAETHNQSGTILDNLARYKAGNT